MSRTWFELIKQKRHCIHLNPMNYLGIITLACFFLCITTVQAQSNRDLLREGMDVLDDGSDKRDYDQILEARSLLEPLTDDDSLAVWAHYYAAAASSAMANMIREGVKEAGNRVRLDHINNSIEHLEAAVAIDPTFADAWMLLSSSYVHKISVRPLRAVGLSRKYRRARDLAFELEPHNPRIKLMKGIINYNLPGFVGGDKALAEAEFDEALKIFEEENITHPFQPSWGHDEVHARLGVVYMDRGDLEEARDAFERALEINPQYGWVTEELLISLEELEAKASSN